VKTKKAGDGEGGKFAWKRENLMNRKWNIEKKKTGARSYRWKKGKEESTQQYGRKPS